MCAVGMSDEEDSIAPPSFDQFTSEDSGSWEEMTDVESDNEWDDSELTIPNENPDEEENGHNSSEVACVQELENAQDLALAVQGLKCACI